MLGVERSTIRRYEERGRLVPAEVRHEGLRRKPLFKRSDVEALSSKEQRRSSGDK
jgi:DNA-binding transcriptional MerR regulator